MIDLTGQKFHRLTVIAQAGKACNGAAKWKCICDCGKEREVRGTDLRSGATKSCGCFGTEKRIAARVGKFKQQARNGTHGEVIRNLCARDIGCSLREAAEAIDRKLNITSVYFVQLLKKGIVTKAGVHGEYRYFTDVDAAKLHDEHAQAERAIKLKESADRKRAYQAERERKKRAAKAALRPPKPAKQAKPKRASTALKPSGLTLSTKRQDQERKREHKAATIIWPEHVKVQKAPTPRDDRFTFTPPSKEWRGVISQDQQERWAA